MNLRDFTYLLAVAELGHFGKAAEACNVSQPTLSMQLKKLEDTLGAPLIERAKGGARLTPLGAQVAKRAKEVMALTQQMRELANAAHDPFAGEITLGAFPTLAPYLLPHIMPNVRAAFPKLTVRLVEEKTATLLEQLSSGALDAALIALPVAPADMETIILFEEPFLLAVPKNHALAGRKSLKLAELAAQELLLLDDGHCMRDQALEVCHRIGAKESQSFRATSLETLRHMVASGAAATLMPKLAVQPDADIRYIPITDPAPYRTIGLVWRKSSPRAQLMQGLSTAIKQSFSRLAP